MSITTQNWDGTITGWNLDANLAASSTFSYSAPNSLALSGSATASTYFYGTYGTADGVGGNCEASTYVFFNTVTTDNKAGLTARGSAATLNNSSTSQYIAYLRCGTTSPKAQISKVISGVETQIGVQVANDNFDAAAWYLLKLSLIDTAITLSVQRVSDGFWLDDTSGDFISGERTCISITDSTLSGSGYWGVVASQPSSNRGIYSDNYGLIDDNPVSGSLIRVPLDGLRFTSDLTGGMTG
jgi:hypothetical protein